MRGTFLTLRCDHCGERLEFSRAEVQAKLRDLSFLRREAEPSEELLLEIAQSLLDSGRWEPCSACGSRRLSEAAALANDENEPWLGDVRACAQCGTSIPPERMEILPDSKLCAACQKKVDSGGSGDHDEYCPHCGDRMQLRAVRSPGAAYRMYCPSCRKSF